MSQDAIWELLSKKLAGEATQEELAELEKLLQSHPETHYAAGHITDLWDQRAEVPMAQREQAFADHLERMRNAGVDWDIPPARRKVRLLRIAGMAAAVLLLAAGAWWWQLAQRSAGTGPHTAGTNEEIHTEKGTRSRILLPDGSVVWLNADSRLSYPSAFHAASREVTLTGEAYFDIQKEASRPFIIHAGQMNVKVLGTAFNVRAYPDESTTETTLIRGSVEVSVSNSSMAPVVLRANEKLVLQREVKEDARALQMEVKPLHYAGHTQTPVETAWVDNKLMFEDISFSQLATQMERWYGVEIRLNDPAIAHLRFTGKFEKETIEQALKALQITADFSYTIHGNHIEITR